MKLQLYICNKADDPRCCKCEHSLPHERWSINKFMTQDKDVCTNYTDCNDENGKKMPFKVRCIKVKES